MTDDQIFTEHIHCTNPHTLRAHYADLEPFANFLNIYRSNKQVTRNDLSHNCVTWKSIHEQLVLEFLKWQLENGRAISSINRALSTVRKYALMATKAGVLSRIELLRIKNISTFSRTEGKVLDASRPKQRVGTKKAQHVRLTPLLAQALKNQPNTPQGRRDRLMMCLLLDHGLRVGEVVLLQVGDIDLDRGRFSFFRPKVDREQTHKLSEDSAIAMRNCYAQLVCLWRCSCQWPSVTRQS